MECLVPAQYGADDAGLLPPGLAFEKIAAMGGSGFTQEFGLMQQWNGARLLKIIRVSKEMVLNCIAEWEVGLSKSY
jgi:alkylation response protein AidB-like acyl-CoA dehydrogenase